MPLSNRRVTSANALKALAHPTRLALLRALTAQGPLTASEAAIEVGSSPSNCSWHLRRLAEDGFVREARAGRAERTRPPTGRERPWQVVREALPWAVAGADEDGLRDEALDDVVMEQEVQRFRAARAARPDEPAEWQEPAGVVRASVWLTAEEARQLTAHWATLVEQYAGRGPDASARPEGARVVSVVGWAVPSGPVPRHFPR